MPWKGEIRQAAIQGLRQAAFKGTFVPRAWNGGFMVDQDGTRSVLACAWGQVCWAVAVRMYGEAYAQQMLPVYAKKHHMYKVLLAAGLTRFEIRRMKPCQAWEHFDNKVGDAYDNREIDPDTFMEISLQMANYFEGVLLRVPTEEQVAQRRGQSLVSRIVRRLSPQPDTKPLAA